MNRQVGSQGKGIWKGDQAVFEIRRSHFHDIELPYSLTLVVTKEGVRGSQSAAEGSADFWRVGADNGQLTVVDVQVLL